MHKFLLAALCVLFLSSAAFAERFFASITAVDAKKGEIVFDRIVKKEKVKAVKATVAKDCVIREGQYRLGKPATTIEGEVLVNGLKNFVFEKASAEVPLRVTIFTADAADADKGIKIGDVIKILVHPK